MSLFLDLLEFDKAFADRDSAPALPGERVVLSLSYADIRRDNLARQMAMPGVTEASDPPIVRPSPFLLAMNTRSPR